MSDENWWDAYSYEEDTPQYVIPNYKIERFKTEVRDLNEQLAEKDKQLELSQKREAILKQAVQSMYDDVLVSDKINYSWKWFKVAKKALKEVGEIK
jgi:hypothetical protein